jgi:hypothetical protein
MNSEAEVTAYIAQNFPGVAVISAPGGSFFFYDPTGDAAADRRFPFVTTTIADDYDTASQLSRPGVFRLNIGLTKDSYRELFGAPPKPPANSQQVIDSGHDFTALDVLMPHPVYAAHHWICVLNPGEATLEKVKLLLAEAYENAVRKYKKLAHREV